MTQWDVVEPVFTLALSVSSILIAARALGESARNGRAQRTHNRLSVKPVIEKFIYRDADTLEIGFWLENRGVGPALITNIEFDRLGKLVKADVEGLFTIFDKLFQGWRYGTALQLTRVSMPHCLPAGQRLNLFTVSLAGTDGKRQFENIYEDLNLFVRLTVDYESVYEERHHYKDS